MSGALGIPFHHTEIDGVPVFWADVPGPRTASLLFRVGRADESLAGAGVSRLVAHLALEALGPRHREVRERVDATITSFTAGGSDDEVVQFLWQLCNTLRGIPLDRLDDDKRVLSAGEESFSPSITERALALRYGAAGHGLVAYEQYGLRWLGQDDVRRWAAERFTRHNAALWLTGPPPAALRLPLNDGVRVPAPSLATRPGLTFPAYARAGSGMIAITVEAERSAALDLATGAVADRAHDLLVVQRDVTREVQLWSTPLDDRHVHKLLAVEVVDEQAGDTLSTLLDLFDDVGSGGPDAAEVEHGRSEMLRAISDDGAVMGGLDQMAVNDLLGAPPVWKEEQAERVTEAGTGPAAGALRGALRTQLVIAPPTVSKPERPLADYPVHSADAVRGIEFRPPGAKPRFGAARPSPKLIVGDDGASHVGIEPGVISTVLLHDVVAAVQEPDGSLTLIGRDGMTVALDIGTFPDVRRATADLENRLPPELLVPPWGALAGGGHDVEALARRKLAGIVPEAELRVLRGWLDDGESVVTMVLATAGPKVGLLTVTDRRVLWICHGVQGKVEQKQLPISDVTSVSLAGRNGRTIALRSPAGETAFSDLHPRERGPELVSEIKQRARHAE